MHAFNYAEEAELFDYDEETVLGERLDSPAPAARLQATCAGVKKLIVLS